MQMKTILALILLSIICLSVQADEYVSGYYQKDGTYVQGYYRSSPNGTTSDNYSHTGNTNLYTGKKGDKN